MVAETSEASKDQQNEIATNENNLFENLSELDLERYLRLNNHTRPKKRSRVCFYVQGRVLNLN